MFSKIEAVNYLLKAIGESPVNSLTAGAPDVNAALAALDRAAREALAVGWECNTDLKVPLQPDSTSRIPIPVDVLSLEAVPPTFKRLRITADTASGLRFLFDRDLNTDTFTAPVYVRVLRSIPFEGLTPALCAYVVESASLRFQQETMGSGTLDQQRLRARAEAWAALLAEEAENDPSNIIDATALGQRIGRRNGPWRF